jgi:hypothetical protein
MTRSIALLQVKRSRTLIQFLSAVLAAPALAGVPDPPVPCSYPPQVAAISFFEFVESPGSEERLRDQSRKILSKELLATSPLPQVVETLASAKRQYALDKRSLPLSGRLAGEPQLLTQGKPGWNPRAQVSVRIQAFSSRGRVEQRVALNCEDTTWKVVSFSYGPPEQ